MKELEWGELPEAWQERSKGTVFWTTGPLEDLEHGLHENGLAFVPHYMAPGKCNSVDVPFPDGSRAGIRIKQVPENHRELRDFCQRVQDELKPKLDYKGESPGVLGDKFVREFLVRKREAIPKAQKDELMEKQ